MEREIAEKLMKYFLAMDGPCNEAIMLTDKIVEEKERKMFRGGIGEILLDIYTELMLPIIKQYPDLDPTNDDYKIRHKH